jgi:hypothetical protein
LFFKILALLPVLICIVKLFRFIYANDMALLPFGVAGNNIATIGIYELIGF